MSVGGLRSGRVRWSLTAAVSAVVVVFTVGLSQWNEGGVAFSDPAFEQLVREKAGREVGELRRTDLLRITHLDGADRGIAGLEGVGALRRLESLRLPRNSIGDVSPLAGLSRLVDVDLSENGLLDLEAAGFGVLADSRIRELRLRGNGIFDVGPIGRMAELRGLDLRDNRVRGLEGLVGLRQLERINLRDNEVQDLTALGELTRLRYLNLHSNFQAQGVETIASLQRLEELILRGVPVGDAAELLVGLPHLRRVNLRESGTWTLPPVEEIIRRAVNVGDVAGQPPWVDLRGTPVLADLRDDELRSLESIRHISGGMSPGVLPPSFSVSRGYYGDAFDLELGAVSGGEVIYTLDGSDPDLEVNASRTHRYRGPVRISERDSSNHPFTDIGLRYDGAPYSTIPGLPAATVVTARAIDDGRASDAVTHTYFVGEDVFNRYGIRIISLAGDSEGFFGPEGGILVAGQIFDDFAEAWAEQYPDGRASSAPANFQQRGRVRLDLEGIEVENRGDGLVGIPYPGHGVDLSFDMRGAVSQIRVSGTAFYDGLHYLDSASTPDKLIFPALFVPASLGPGASATADWERPVSLEIFGSDGTAKHVSGAGVRVHGATSRAHQAKSLRLYLRGEYGERRLQTSIFGESDLAHRRLLLRRALHRSGLEDVMAQELMRRLHPDAYIQRYAPVVLFLNGDLLGSYNVRDRYDQWFLAGIHDVDPSSIALLGGRGVPVYGDDALGDSFRELEKYVRTADLSEPQALEFIETQMDIDNYIAYMINGIFLNYHDWGVGKHRRVWRSLDDRSDVHPSLDGRWRWLPLDLDLTFHARATVERDYLRQIASSSTYMLRYLLQNQEFSDRFLQRFREALDDTYEPKSTLALLEQLAAEIHVADQDGLYGRSSGSWEGHVEQMRTFLTLRPGIVQAHLEDFFAGS